MFVCNVFVKNSSVKRLNSLIVIVTPSSIYLSQILPSDAQSFISFSGIKNLGKLDPKWKLIFIRIFTKAKFNTAASDANILEAIAIYSIFFLINEIADSSFPMAAYVIHHLDGKQTRINSTTLSAIGKLKPAISLMRKNVLYYWV